ncbi:MAG: hypothetical protein AAB262_14320 [Elusimicrobiota bacterium]
MSHPTSSTRACQIFACALLALAAPRPARGQAAAADGASLAKLVERFSKVRLYGSMALNWRNVGPKEPGYETQIQNEVYLADMYFGAEGPVAEGLPFRLEWNVPSSNQGTLRLHQVYFEYNRVRRIRLQFGKFLVPFGRYNELYRPDQFLAVTRPLLYASPDSIDLVVRPNSPRPPVSAGYTDIGARFSWYPVRQHPLVPVELTAFVVNGLSESTNRSRTFPNPSNLGIPGPPTNGVTPDFGHQNNNLADNNNSKTAGARIVFALGDLRLPFPIPERAADLNGVMLGLSGMGGHYDLEGRLTYQMYGLDWSLEYGGISLSGEAMYSNNQFLNPLVVSTSSPSSAELVSPVAQARLREHIYGYFIQSAFPILRKPPYGERLTGVLVFNQMYRRGPLLDFMLDYKDGSTIIPSMTGFREGTPFVTREIFKYTAALHYKLSPHFALKFDYSYWVMGKSTVRSQTSLGVNDIYQGAFSMVMGF